MNSRRLIFDHLVGASEQSRRHFEANGLSRFEVDDELELRRLLDRDVGFGPRAEF
jgi:hypothetical protein